VLAYAKIFMALAATSLSLAGVVIVGALGQTIRTTAGMSTCIRGAFAVATMIRRSPTAFNWLLAPSKSSGSLTGGVRARSFVDAWLWLPATMPLTAIAPAAAEPGVPVDGSRLRVGPPRRSMQCV
jgi:hypothetical protein